MSSETKGEKPVNVKVIVRCRPPNSDEKNSRSGGVQVVATSQSQREIAVTQTSTGQGGKQTTKKFHFDEVFGPTSSQEDIFDSSISGIVDEVLTGFNCTVFAYGQTGTGKTYTMEGARDEDKWTIKQDTDGVIPRAVRRIFSTLEKNKTEFNVRVSFLELYNEELSDLIAGSDYPVDASMSSGNAPSGPSKKLKIFDDPTGRRGRIVQGLEEVCVSNVSEVMELLDKSGQRRKVAETLMNKHSSRSHSIFTIVIHIKETTSDGEELLKIGKLNLVDLAGSECIGKSGALNQRAKEAGKINQSLLTLGRVITALVDHAPHIPYRESRLTRLLQDSLGGKTKTCIIATVSPCACSLDETLSTLDYANRAKSIKNKPVVNQKMTKKSLIKEYAQEIASLTAMLNAARDKNGVYIPTDKYNEMTAQIQAQDNGIKGLEADMEKKIKEFTELKELLGVTEIQLREETEAHHETKSTLKQTEENLKETESELIETKEVVLDKEAIIDEHAEVETDLHETGTTAINTLKETTTDISGLFAKVGRQVTAEDRNMSEAEAFNKDAGAQLGSLKKSLDEFGAQHAEATGSLAKTATEFAEGHAAKSTTVAEAIAKAAEAAREAIAALAKGSAEASEASSASIKTVSSQAKSVMNAAAEDASSRINAIVAALEAVSVSVAEQAEAVRAMESDFEAHRAKQEKTISDFAAQHAAAIKSAKEAVEGASARAIEAETNAKEAVNEFAAKAEADAADARDAIIAKITEAATEFFTAQAKSISESAEVATTAIDSAIEATETAKEEISSPIDAAAEAVAKLSEAHTDASGEAATATTESADAAVASLGAATDDISAVIALGKDLTAASENFAADGVAQVEKLTVDAKTEAEATITRINESAEEASQSATAAESEANGVTEDMSAFAVAHVGKTKKDLESLESVASGFVRAQGDHVSVVEGEIDAFCADSLRRVEITGDTPVKKEWRIPGPLARTRDHVVIAEERRARRALIVDTSEDSEDDAEAGDAEMTSEDNDAKDGDANNSDVDESEDQDEDVGEDDDEDEQENVEVDDVQLELDASLADEIENAIGSKEESKENGTSNIPAVTQGKRPVGSRIPMRTTRSRAAAAK